MRNVFDSNDPAENYYMDWKLLCMVGMNLRTQFYAYKLSIGSRRMSLTAAWGFVVLLLTAASLNFSAFGNETAGTTQIEGQASNFMALSLEQLLEVDVDKVYGASKYEQRTTQAPSSVSLVTRDEIQKHGYRTLADVMRSVNGIYVSDDHNYSYVGIRGFNRPGDYSSRVLLLVDGHRMNDNIYGQGLYGTEGFLDVDLIERVEVIRGPSSSIYGNNAFFGVVNVVTREGPSVNGLEVTGEVGSDEAFKGGFILGKQLDGGIELLLSASAFDTAGESRVYFPEFDSPATNNGQAENSDEDRAYRLYGSAGWSDFTLAGGWSWRRKDIPTASFGTTFNDGGEFTTDERAYVDLKAEHEFTDTVKFIGHAAYDWSWYAGDYPYGTGAGRYVNRDDSRGEWASADLQLNWQPADWCRLIFGGDFQENFLMEQRNYDVSPAAIYLNDHQDGNNFGVFAQAEICLVTNLVLNAGGRIDHYSSFGESANPRLALIYQPWTETTFKALYGQAFRAPNAYELYYSYPGQAKANPGLQPEEIRTYELVWEQGVSGSLKFSASGYYYEIEGLASQVVDPNDGLLVFQNTDAATALGLELGLEARYKNGLTTRIGYALQQAEDATTNLELSNSPRHLAKFNLTAPLWADKLWAGFDVQYSSPVRTVLGNDSQDIVVANATLFGRPLGQDFEVSASIYNLFDERDGYSASTEHVQDTIPLAGRSFRVKVTYRF